MSQLTDAQERLALYKSAEQLILKTGQSVKIGSQEYSRANIQWVQTEIRRLEQQIAQLSTSGRLSHSQTVFGGRR